MKKSKDSSKYFIDKDKVIQEQSSSNQLTVRKSSKEIKYHKVKKHHISRNNNSINKDEHLDGTNKPVAISHHDIDNKKTGEKRTKQMENTNKTRQTDKDTTRIPKKKDSQKQINKLKKKNRKSRRLILILLALFAIMFLIGGKGFGLGSGGLGFGRGDSKSETQKELLVTNDKGEVDENVVVIAVKEHDIFLNAEKMDTIEKLEKKVLSFDLDKMKLFLKDVNAKRKEYSSVKDFLDSKDIKFTEYSE